MNDFKKNSSIQAVCKSIRALRHQRGWSQKQIADCIGISIPAFSKIEAGFTDINLSRLEQIANAFDISIIQLLSTENNVQPMSITSNENNFQKKISARDIEISNLQRKIIELYEELLNKSSITPYNNKAS